jgi:quinolinate synthase
MDAARKPLERMLEMAGGTVGKGDVGTPQIREDRQGGVAPADIDPSISGD